MSTLRVNNITDTSGGSSLTVGGGAPARIGQASAQASTSGAAIDFTGIPSWAKRVTVMFNGVSTNGSSNLAIRIGSGSIASTGYNSTAWTANTNNAIWTDAFVLTAVNAASVAYYGNVHICLLGSNTWVSSHSLGGLSGGYQSLGGGAITLSGTLDRLRVINGGTDTFDAGSINILYEG